MLILQNDFDSFKIPVYENTNLFNIEKESHCKVYSHQICTCTPHVGAVSTVSGEFDQQIPLLVTL